MTKALIVEDLPAAAEALKSLIQAHCPHINVEGHALTVVEAAKMLRSIQPDLLFLDIELPDGTGFDLLDIAGAWQGPIIFTTGLNDQALKAFQYAAVDYLLKPIDPAELQRAVEKAGRLIQNTQEQRQYLQQLNASTTLPNRLALHSQDRIQLVNVSDIVRCQAEGNYTQFFFKNDKPLLIAKTLKSYGELLEEHGFLRVHQSHLINPQYLKEFVKTDGGYLVMEDGTKVSVSVRRRALVMKYLK